MPQSTRRVHNTHRYLSQSNRPVENEKIQNFQMCSEIQTTDDDDNDIQNR